MKAKALAIITFLFFLPDLAAGETLVLIIDCGGIPSSWFFDPDGGAPFFRTAARQGIAFLSLISERGDPKKALENFLGQGQRNLLEKASEKYRKLWFFSSRWYGISLPKNFKCFSPDLREPTFKKLISRYGIPRTVGDRQLGMVSLFRKELGAPLEEMEVELTRALTDPLGPRRPDSLVLSYLSLVVKENGVFACAVLSASDIAHEDIQKARKVLKENQESIARIWEDLQKSPFRDELVFAYVSLLGRERDDFPADHPAGGVSCAVLVGPKLAKGIVVQKEFPVSSLRDLLLWQLGWGNYPKGVPVFLARKK